MKIMNLKKLYNTIKRGMQLKSVQDELVLTGGQISDTLYDVLEAFERIEGYSFNLEAGVRNCIGNAKKRKDNFDVGYLEAMLKDIKRIRELVKVVNPRLVKVNTTKPLTEMDLETIDDALETMEMHGMHTKSSYKNLKAWHNDKLGLE